MKHRSGTLTPAAMNNSTNQGKIMLIFIRYSSKEPLKICVSFPHANYLQRTNVSNAFSWCW